MQSDLNLIVNYDDNNLNDFILLFNNNIYDYLYNKSSEIKVLYDEMIIHLIRGNRENDKEKIEEIITFVKSITINIS